MILLLEMINYELYLLKIHFIVTYKEIISQNLYYKVQRQYTVLEINWEELLSPIIHNFR